MRSILEYVSTLPKNVGTVAIGGISINNAQRVIYQSQSLTKGLDGVAIVSAIMAAEDPQKAATALAKAISKNPQFATVPQNPRDDELKYLLDNAINVVRRVATQGPLCHSMINYVVANFAANVALQM